MSNEWRIVQEAFSVRVEADDEIIYVRHLPDWNDESYASELKGALSNAALIRSSRGLLEALQKIQFRCECFIDDDRDMRVASLEVVKSICDEAIAKAIAQ